MTLTLPMVEKEIAEARRARIPEKIIGKMAQGFELTENEKDIVEVHGLVYVRVHRREKGKFVVRPHLRKMRETTEYKMVYGTGNSKERRPGDVGYEEELEAWNLVRQTYDGSFEEGDVTEFLIDEGINPEIAEEVEEKYLEEMKLVEELEAKYIPRYRRSEETMRSVRVVATPRLNEVKINGKTTTYFKKFDDKTYSYNSSHHSRKDAMEFMKRRKRLTGYDNRIVKFADRYLVYTGK